jgi:hypothetical protein
LTSQAWLRTCDHDAARSDLVVDLVVEETGDVGLLRDGMTSNPCEGASDPCEGDSLTQRLTPLPPSRTTYSCPSLPVRTEPVPRPL